MQSSAAAFRRRREQGSETPKWPGNLFGNGLGDLFVQHVLDALAGAAAHLVEVVESDREVPPRSLDPGQFTGGRAPGRGALFRGRHHHCEGNQHDRGEGSGCQPPGPGTRRPCPALLARNTFQGPAQRGRRTLEAEFVQALLQPGGEAEPHFHEKEHQVFYVIAGQAEVTLGGEAPELCGPGTIVRIPPRLLHRVVATGPEPLEVLIVYSPPLPAKKAFLTAAK